MQVLNAADQRKRELEELEAQERAEQEAAAAFVASKEAAAKETELRQRLGYWSRSFRLSHGAVFFVLWVSL